MDPISFSIELELGSLLLAAVGMVATWLNHRHRKADRASMRGTIAPFVQRERHQGRVRTRRTFHHGKVCR